jgi:phage terminase large subunit-like protein
MAGAVDALETAVLDRRIRHGGHPVLAWNISNAIVASDPAGNRKLDKARSRERIDGAVALVMSMGLHAREAAPDTGPSVYEFESFFI